MASTERSVVGGLFDFLGITGSGIPTSTLAPPVLGDVGKQSREAAWNDNAKVDNPTAWSVYQKLNGRPQDLDSMMRVWADMASWDLLTAALTELVDEATQPDPITDQTIWYECTDPALEDELNNMLLTVGATDILPSEVWHVAGLGNNFERVHYEPGQGVLGLSYANPMDVRRYWLEKNRRCIGFRWANHKPDNDPLYVLGGKTVPRVGIQTGDVPEDLFYPWDFVHMRRIFRMRTNEHGEPVYGEAEGIYKKLRMALDQMSVHRAQVQPDRYAIHIDTQQQPVNEQMRTIQRWKQSMRSRVSYGMGGDSENIGTPTDMRSYYDAWGLDSILWLAKPTGFQHSIEKLPGTASVPDVYDVELLTNLFFAIIRQPKSWLGIGGAGENGPTSGKALLAQDMRFLRGVKAVRKPVTQGWTWLGYLHANLRGYDTSNVEIKAQMSNISTLEDQLRLELFEKQVDVMDKLGNIFEKYRLEPAAWLDLMFKRYMRLPDDIVDALRVQLPPEVELKMESAASRLTAKAGVPRVQQLLKELEHAVESQGLKRHVQDIQRMVYERDVPPPRGTYPKFDTTRRPIYETEEKENDVIVSSFGEMPVMRKLLTEAKQGQAPASAAPPTGPSGITESQRKYI